MLPPPYKSGFTLAEVLITLLIIGVIAAITVPTLIAKYQKEQTVVKLKKVYSTLSQATNRAISDNGPIRTWEIVNYNTGGQGKGSLKFAEKYLEPYLNLIANCKNESLPNCKFQYSFLNSDEKHEFGGETSKFVLSDGTLVAVMSFVTIDYTGTYISVAVYVDINGMKKPNKFGKDIFEFIFYPTKEKLELYSETSSRARLTDSSFRYSCTKQNEGQMCAALILKDGWRIADDYPW